jgi:hypothetical protein
MMWFHADLLRKRWLNGRNGNNQPFDETVDAEIKP